MEAIDFFDNLNYGFNGQTSGYPVLPFENSKTDMFYLEIRSGGDFSTMSGEISPAVKSFLFSKHKESIKEGFYVTAIDNLLKKTEFLQLSIQLDQDLISEEEFHDELINNEDKYLIRMSQTFDKENFKIISEILPKFNRNFSSDDVSELFSIPHDEVLEYFLSSNE